MLANAAPQMFVFFSISSKHQVNRPKFSDVASLCFMLDRYHCLSSRPADFPFLCPIPKNQCPQIKTLRLLISRPLCNKHSVKKSSTEHLRHLHLKPDKQHANKISPHMSVFVWFIFKQKHCLNKSSLTHLSVAYLIANKLQFFPEVPREPLRMVNM